MDVVWLDQPATGPVEAGTDPGAAKVAELLLKGPVVITLGDTGPGAMAAAAVYAWLGVAGFRVEPAGRDELRQVLDMVASIKGIREPAVNRRALA